MCDDDFDACIGMAASIPHSMRRRGARFTIGEA